ncbi:MAG: hypothetical protein AB7S77_02740 [Desulfatirhabdiaceae bacterium]
MNLTEHDQTRIANPARPIIEGLAIGFFSLVAMSVCIYFIYVRALSALQEEIKEGLTRNVSAIATTIDGDLHKQFRSKSQKNDPEYMDYLKKLEAIRQASKYVRYLYTNILVDGKVYFIANPSPQNDNDGDGKPDEAPQLMEPYPDAGEGLLTALREKKATVDREPYTDKWGTFYSAYAPFFDSDGNFEGTIGMDLELAGFNERLEPIKVSTKRAFIAALALAVLFGTAVWFFRRLSAQLLDSRIKMTIQLIEARKTSQEAMALTCSYLQNISRVVREGLRDDRNSETLYGFMADLDRYAILKTATGDGELKNFQTEEFMGQLCCPIEPVYEKRHIVLKTNFDPNVPAMLLGDPDKLLNMLSTLLLSDIFLVDNGNAFLSIKLGKEELHRVELHIGLIFTWTGMDMADIDELFEPFSSKPYPLELQREKLKLATIREMIRTLDGAVQASLLPDATLSITFNAWFRKFKEARG